MSLTLIASLPLGYKWFNTSAINIFNPVVLLSFALIKHILLDHRSDGASTSNTHRARRSTNITPEISDDIVRLAKMVFNSDLSQNNGQLLSPVKTQ